MHLPAGQPTVSPVLTYTAVPLHRSKKYAHCVKQLHAYDAASVVLLVASPHHRRHSEGKMDE